jgi:hypothetical protein
MDAHIIYIRCYLIDSSRANKERSALVTGQVLAYLYASFPLFYELSLSEAHYQAKSFSRKFANASLISFPL